MKIIIFSRKILINDKNNKVRGLICKTCNQSLFVSDLMNATRHANKHIDSKKKSKISFFDNPLTATKSPFSPLKKLLLPQISIEKETFKEVISPLPLLQQEISVYQHDDVTCKGYLLKIKSPAYLHFPYEYYNQFSLNFTIPNEHGFIFSKQCEKTKTENNSRNWKNGNCACCQKLTSLTEITNIEKRSNDDLIYKNTTNDFYLTFDQLHQRIKHAVERR